MAQVQKSCDLPSFLPNASRVLLAAFDKWHSSSKSSPEEKLAVLRALTASLKEEGEAAAPRVESIPYLIATEDPPAKWCASLPLNAPPLAELLR